MNYRKRALTFDAQLAQLKDRGLSVRDEGQALHWLANVSYYRLSAYSLPFRHDDRFHPGTDFSDIVDLYVFDRRLRLLLLDAIERIEVASRTAVTYEISHALGAFGYADRSNFSPKFQHGRFLADVSKEEGRANETFVEHFRKKYTSEIHLPIWMVTELISFGALSQLYAHLSPQLRSRVAVRYHVHESVFANWLHALSYVRNVCAHHKRLWNRELAIRPMVPRNDRRWARLSIDNTRLAASLAVIAHLLQCVAPGSEWADRVAELFDAYPNVPRAAMGFKPGDDVRKVLGSFVS